MFEFSAPTGAAGPLLQQWQVLPPGEYHLAGQSEGVEQTEEARPYWALTCANGRELGRLVLPNSAQAEGVDLRRQLHCSAELRGADAHFTRAHPMRWRAYRDESTGFNFLPCAETAETQPCMNDCLHYLFWLPPRLRRRRGTQVGGTANSAVGQIGQRQSADQAKSQTPTGRIASRVQSRVQSRLRNRIDRDYDPQGLWASPFAVAQERARAPARRRR